MNIRLQKYKKNRLAGMNQYNAALAAGYSKATAVKSNRLEKHMDGLVNHFQRAGLTDLKIATTLAQALDAEKVTKVRVVNELGENGVKIKKEKSVKRPDWPTRLKALELVANLSGMMKSKVEHSGNLTFTQMADIALGAKSENRILEYDID